MQRTALARPLELLLIEDNEADIRLLQEVLKESSVPTRLAVVQDGLEALAFLRREAPHEQAHAPDLILLDLNLPGKPGLEVLEEVSAEPHLRRIPCVILTNSRAPGDIVRSYELCANCYVVKPTDLEDFQKIIHLLEEFWLTAAELPSRYLHAS